MIVIGISGSPRSGGNTEIIVKLALDHMEKEGFETDFLPLSQRNIKPCTACGGCGKSDKVECVQPDPDFEDVIDRFTAADAVIVGSPVYFGSATPQIMSLLDRVGYVARCNKNFLRRKVGASIVVARRAGQNFTFAQLNYFFLVTEMIVPGSTYWNVGQAVRRGDINQDHEALDTVRDLAGNMAWLLRRIGSGV